MDSITTSDAELNIASTLATQYLHEREKDDYPTIETSEVSLADEILEVIFSVGYGLVSEEKKQPSARRLALKLRNELDMMRTWADDLHIIEGALQRILQDSRELSESLYEILGEFLSLLLSCPKVTIDSKYTLRLLQDKVSWILPQVDEYQVFASKLNSRIKGNDDDDDAEESDSELELDFEESDSEAELDFEEFVDEFKDSSEIFRFLACSLADEMERTSNKILQEPPPTVTPTLINMPEYQFKVNIQDKLPHARKHLVERLAVECWRLYQSVKYGLQKQSEMEIQSTPLKGGMTVSASDEGYRTALNQQTQIAPSLIDGLPQKAIVPMHDIAQYALSIASSAPENTSDRPKLPRLPPGAEFGKPFICQICCISQSSINSLQDWKQHIYTDLQPYLCTFENCPLKKDTYTVRFSNRQHWWQHEMSHHRLQKSYKCALTGCGAVRASKDQFLDHVRADHPRLQLKDGSIIISECSKEHWDLDITLMYCPFCDDCKGERKSKLSQHIAHHFEDQALNVLGIAGGFKEEEDSEEEGNDMDSNRSLSGVVDPEDIEATSPSSSAARITGIDSSFRPGEEINCICGYFGDGGGHVLQCERCGTVQHTLCVRMGHSTVENPGGWICHVCEPDRVSEASRERAYKMQRSRKEELSQNTKDDIMRSRVTGEAIQINGPIYGDNDREHQSSSKNEGCRTAFFTHCMNGNLLEAKTLLEREGDNLLILEPDNAGYLPIHVAAINGCSEVVEFLISMGSPVDQCALDSTSPLLDAVEGCHTDIVKMLIAAGANPSRKTKAGRTVLAVANSIIRRGHKNAKEMQVIESLLRAHSY